MNLDLTDAELVEVICPSSFIIEDLLSVSVELLDNGAGELTLTHIGERLSIDDIVLVASAQQLLEILSALRERG